MPSYRGDFARMPRDPHPECLTESDSVLPYNAHRCCGQSDPFTGTGWYCTRPNGHRGDHAALRLDGFFFPGQRIPPGTRRHVIVRWGRQGEATDG